MEEDGVQFTGFNLTEERQQGCVRARGAASHLSAERCLLAML